MTSFSTGITFSAIGSLAHTSHVYDSRTALDAFDASNEGDCCPHDRQGRPGCSDDDDAGSPREVLDWTKRKGDRDKPITAQERPPSTESDSFHSTRQRASNLTPPDLSKVCGERVLDDRVQQTFRDVRLFCVLRKYELD